METLWGPTIREGDESDVLVMAMTSDVTDICKTTGVILSEAMC